MTTNVDQLAEAIRRHDAATAVALAVIRRYDDDQITAAQAFSRIHTALTPEEEQVTAHDFDPIWEGCCKCAALPGDAEVCEPPEKWVPMSDWRDDPLAVAMARLVAVLIITFRVKQVVRWLAKKFPPTTERTDQK